MAFNDAAMTLAANAIRAAAVGAQLHTSAAGVNGTAHLCASGRQAVTWASPSTLGSFGLASPLAFTGGTPSGPVYSVTLWSTSTTGGTFYGEFLLAGDAAFNGSGEYTVSAIDLTGTAT